MEKKVQITLTVDNVNPQADIDAILKFMDMLKYDVVEVKVK